MTRGVLALALCLWGLGAARDGVDAWVDATVLPPLGGDSSVEVLDRHGAMLRAYTMANGRWRLPVTLDQVDPAYLRMLIRYEDKRFRDHSGVDPMAMLRAAGQALRGGRIVSGGSTLTMQVARLLEEGSTGRWAGKLRQIRVALALERRLSKDEILTLYLDHAPFGGNIEGVRAASYAYFDRPPARLTPAQAALLVALPQSPEARRPDRAPQIATEARDMVLARLQGDGLLDDATVVAAMRNPVSATRHGFPALAPHLADRAVAEEPFARIHRLTIDRSIQSALEQLAAASVAGRSDLLQVAIVAADHQTGEIIASVGSAGYQADGRAGFIDLTQTVRSPGSTLKPLIYGLGFGAGMIHPETVIADRLSDFDGYRPQNFDGQFRGDIRVREALQQSLNIPAVAVTQALGPHHVMAGLRHAGADPQVPGGTPGLAIALGGLGLSLTELTGVYAALGNGGTAVDLRWRAAATPGFVPEAVLPRAAAWHVADILRDVPRPTGVRAEGIAYKTGTSYGHRDAWALGFDGWHVVGVWMGRADGTPVPGAFGGELAAPVMFAAFARLAPTITPLGSPPRETLLVSTSRLPQQLQRFGGARAAETSGPAIAFPPDGAVVEGQVLVAKVRDGRAPYLWMANGTPLARSNRAEITLDGIGVGFSELTVIDADGRADQASIELRR